MNYIAFRNEKYFLSNMYPCTVVWNGIRFGCSECAYIYMSIDPVKGSHIQPFIIGMEGKVAKVFMKKHNHTIKNDWNSIKYHIMNQIVFSKFIQNPDLIEKLKAIREDIIEYNVWHDNYWGVCTCDRCQNVGVSQNKLGEILMDIRDFFRGAEKK